MIASRSYLCQTKTSCRCQTETSCRCQTETSCRRQTETSCRRQRSTNVLCRKSTGWHHRRPCALSVGKTKAKKWCIVHVPNVRRFIIFHALNFTNDHRVMVCSVYFISCGV